MNAPARACNYALLRFRPYPDGGEFVNVGLVLWCEQTRAFRYCCDNRCMDRVHAFFPQLDLHDFDHTMTEMRDEIVRVGAAIALPQADARRAYKELVRVREGLLTFGPNATVMTADEDQLLEQLIERYLFSALMGPEVSVA